MTYPCSKAAVHQAIAAWAGVPVSALSAQTQLDGLGGKSWPQDASSLIPVLEELCSCVIPEGDYEIWETVEDVDDYLGAD